MVIKFYFGHSKMYSFALKFLIFSLQDTDVYLIVEKKAKPNITPIKIITITPTDLLAFNPLRAKKTESLIFSIDHRIFF